MILDKDTIKTLAKHLSKYTFYMEQINDLEVEIINNSSSDINSGIRSKNKVSRTTEDIAIALASSKELSRLKAITKAIDDLRIELLNDENRAKLKLLNYKYLNQASKVSDLYVMQRITDEGYPLPSNAYYTMKEKILYRFEKLLNDAGIKT